MTQFKTNLDDAQPYMHALHTLDTFVSPLKGDQVLIAKNGYKELFLTVVNRKWENGELYIELNLPANTVFDKISGDYGFEKLMEWFNHA